MIHRKKICLKYISLLLIIGILSVSVSAQNVGIGTAAPASKLSISGAVSIGSAYTAISAPANGLTVEGFMGIGTSAPTYPFHLVYGGSNQFAAYIDYSGPNSGAGGLFVKTGNTTSGATLTGGYFQILSAASTATTKGIYIQNQSGGATNYGLHAFVLNSGANNNYGVYTSASGATTNYGGYFTTSNSTTSYSLYAKTTGAGTTGYGIRASSVGSTTNWAAWFGDINANDGRVYIEDEVGIGTTSLNEKLNVNGAINLGSTSTSNAGTIRYTGSDFEGYMAGSWHSLTTASDADWTIAGNNVYSAVSGNVGIGITSPLYKLSINQSGNQTSTVYITHVSSNTISSGLYITASSSATGGTLTGGYFKTSASASSSITQSIYALNAASANTNKGLALSVSGTGTTNYGIHAQVSGATTASFGALLDVSSSGGTNYALEAWAHGTGTTNYGIHSAATGASGSNWAAWFGSTYTDDGRVYIKDQLGIGTTTLSEKLNVNGAIKIGNTSGFNPGTIRYTGSDFEGYMASSWHSLTSGSDADWTVSGINMYSTVSGNVGIGLTVPVTKLQVQSSNDVLFGASMTAIGSKLYWDASKSAFRAGYVNSTQWDAANVGQYSFATGTNTIASGSRSVAMGNNNTASGTNAVALGLSNTSSGIASLASGNANTASGNYAAALGSNNTTTGLNAIALGYNNSVAATDALAGGYTNTINSGATGSIALGYNNYITSFQAYALGNSNTVSANSVAIGSNNTSSYNSSIAIGSNNTASGWYSTAMGFFTTSQAYGDFVIGRYNVGGGSYSSWIATDKLFEIGNGTSSAHANAMTVLKNGNVGIGISTPASKLDLDYSGTQTSGLYNTYVYSGTNSGAGITVDASLSSGINIYSGVFNVISSASATNTIALMAQNNNLGATNNFGLKAMVGSAGTNNYAVYAYTSGSSSSDWAGYFGHPTYSGRVYIKDTLGIGTTTLSEKLTVNGAIKIANTSGFNPGTIRYTGSDFEGYMAGNWHSLTAGSDGDWTVSGIDMYSAVSGNVGIGTSTPSQKLDVVGNIKLPATTTTSGTLYAGSQRFLHNYGYHNVFLGLNAGNYTLNISSIYGFNVGIGSYSLGALTTGKWNTAVGYLSLGNDTTGKWNTAVGYRSLYYNGSGSANTAFGLNSLYANTTGNYNVAVGYNALRYNRTGTYNTAIGDYAGFYNVSGLRNVFLGYGAGYSETGSGKLYIDNSTTTQPLIWGDFSSNDAAINGNLSIGSQTFSTGANNVLAIFNGTVPTVSVANGVQLYAEGASASELTVRDEAGNTTVLSPHNFSLIPGGRSESMSWAYYSERDGKVINVDMGKVVRLIEQLSGEKLIWILDRETNTYLPSTETHSIGQVKQLEKELLLLKKQNALILQRIDALEKEIK